MGASQELLAELDEALLAARSETPNPQLYRCRHYRALKRAKIRAEIAGDVPAIERIAVALREASKEQTNQPQDKQTCGT